MNMWTVYRRSDRRVMAMFQLLWEAAHYSNIDPRGGEHHGPDERLYIKRVDPAVLEKGKDWFIMPKHLAYPDCGPYAKPTESGEFRHA